MIVIGLGKAGCAIAEKFKQYPQYDIFKMDVGLKGKKCFNMPSFPHPEQYEKDGPILKVRTFLKGVEKKDVLFICSCGIISGVSLRVLEQLVKKKCKVTILYIQPDRQLLGEMKIKQDNLMFGVMQEYARSGKFEKVILVSNKYMSEVIGEVPIREYYDKVNEAVASTFHMTNVFSHSDPVLDTFSPEGVPSLRITTLGLVNYNSGEEKLFFPLDKIRDVRYYYAMPNKILDEDGKLLSKVTDQVKSKIEYEGMKTSFGIFSTQYDDALVYSFSRASMVQKNEKSL